MKIKYQEGASALIKERRLDIVIAGHTHIQEDYTFDTDKRYINIGYPIKDNSFLLYKNNIFEFKKIN